MPSFSVICLFRVPGAGLRRHASDIRKIYEGQSFYKDKGKWWRNYQVNDLVVFNDFNGSNCQLPHRLKLDFHQCDMPCRLIFCALVQCIRI